jgi:DUF4097 and DUF4098 domain-containing protein YvlB
MKTIVLAVFMSFIALSAFCGGNFELVNTQEIELENIIDVKIVYSSERVSVFMGTTDTLIIKEYMSENNSQYFAKIIHSGNTVTIENGDWPFRFFLNAFNRRLEVYLPLSYQNTLNIKTSSGKIETSDLFCSKIGIESSSGNISVKSITADTINIKSASGKIHGEKIQGNINLCTSSGDIDFGATNGNVSVETSSGDIDLGLVNGSVNAKASSGDIRCTIVAHTGDISLNTTSGTVRLNLPANLPFSFSSRTSSGKLSTPFSDRLSNPVTDRNLTQGFIGNNNGSGEILVVNISTRSGSIIIEWA